MKAVILTVPAIALGVSIFVLSAKQPQQEQIGSFATPIAGRTSNQRHNAQLVLIKINGVRIPPSAEFSFNETVGPWTRDRGYRRAPVSFGGQLVDAWGGGVCQTSSTLYNAALLAGLEILERSPHHYAPSYVAPGRDAAVAFPNIDLKFKNTSDHDIVIVGSIKSDQLMVGLQSRGKAPDVSIMQRPVSIIRPHELVIGGEGRRYVRNPGKYGYEVETFRMTQDKRELVSRDSYPVMNRIIDSRSTP